MFFLRKFNVRKSSLFDWLNTISGIASVGRGWVSTSRRFCHGVVGVNHSYFFPSLRYLAAKKYMYHSQTPNITQNSSFLDFTREDAPASKNPKDYLKLRPKMYSTMIKPVLLSSLILWLNMWDLLSNSYINY